MHESNLAGCVSYTYLHHFAFAYMKVRIRVRRKGVDSISPLLFALEKGRKRGEENTAGRREGSSGADGVPGLSCTATSKPYMARVG